MYASDYGVDVGEATRRLRLQDRVGKLSTALETKEEDSFAGLWIQHKPKFRVITRFTQGGLAKVRPYVKESPLANIVETKPATLTLAELEAAEYKAARQFENQGIRADSSIDVSKNEIKLYVTKRAPVEAARRSKRIHLPEQATVVEVSGLSKPSAYLYGGRWLYLANSRQECTAGFSVKHRTKGYGITTAGHCPPTSYRGDYRQLYFGYKRLPLAGTGRTRGPYDVQWHRPNGHVPIQRFWDGNSTRPINGARGWGRVVRGQYTCHYGAASGTTCGRIRTKYYRPTAYIDNASARFVVVHNPRNRNISSFGDSGGPWFTGYKAYGIHSGAARYGNRGYIDSIYMPINFVRGLDLWIRW